ncbi:8819_t:CDS:2 [Ambispora gerdemannii]|uniref:8819_t:CDS:1 n=1 Tax=Ambispora gerdemannii TaxID=144530 RepID=A0A9N8ZSN6_9GLOM|nr:8819_t:CDS:2 [Ambispora gerdemannii]
MTSNKRVRTQEGQEVTGNKHQKIHNNEYSKRYREKKKQEFIDLQNKLESRDEEIRRLTENIQKLEKEKESRDEEIQQLIMEKISMRDKIQILKEEKESYNEEIQRLIMEKTSMCDKIQNLEKEKESLDSKWMTKICEAFTANENTPLELNQIPLSPISPPNQEINISLSSQKSNNSPHNTINENTPLSPDQNTDTAYTNTHFTNPLSLASPSNQEINILLSNEESNNSSPLDQNPNNSSFPALYLIDPSFFNLFT